MRMPRGTEDLESSEEAKCLSETTEELENSDGQEEAQSFDSKFRERPGDEQTDEACKRPI